TRFSRDWSSDVCSSDLEILSKDHNLILLDDAYQHRKVKPSTSILVFEYQSILEPIFLLPTGQYRDTFDQTKRANLILISKCPDRSEERRVGKEVECE